VAAALQVEEFSEAAVWKVLRQVGLKALGPQNYKEQQDLAGTERPNVLRRLFVELASIPQRELESVLDISTVKSFLALDLLRPSLDQQQYYAPVFLYPVADLIIASDRYNGPPGLPLFEESVYPAIESHSLRLLDLLPRRHISRALDLGTGSGIYALALSQHTDRVVAVDINPRAVHFARFNSLLNGRSENVEVIKADLYSELASQTFDLIVAFPPSTPSTEGMETWRDGGPSGETFHCSINGAQSRPKGEAPTCVRAGVRAGVWERISSLY
jgi:SAM-dependent methyltransferase